MLGLIHHPRLLFALPVLTVLIGWITFVAVMYRERHPRTGGDAMLPDRRRLVSLGASFLCMGLVTLSCGIIRGGPLFVLGIVGYVLSLYLSIAFFIVAIRRQ